MHKVVVATDLSARSHRAVRRAVLLARASGAEITLLHVVDDDQPDRMIDAERAVAEELLADQARSLIELDAVSCRHEVALGEPFEAIARLAARQAADVVVIGQHRRAILRDFFLGTTAERTIRTARLPVLKVSTAPAGPYRAVLAASDLSDAAAGALATAASLGLTRDALVAVLHAFVPLARTMLARAAMAPDDALVAGQAETASAAAELDAHLATWADAPDQRLVWPAPAGAAAAVCEAARNLHADLVVIGTRQRPALQEMLLGSVSGEVLRYAPCDVLAVPPAR